MTITDPKHESLMPPEDAEWRTWYDCTNSAQQILAEIAGHPSGTFAQRVTPLLVIRYGHRIGAILARKKLKYSQLRRFVDALKDIDMIKDLDSKKRKLVLFQVQLVHGYSRKAELEPFYVITKGIIERNWIDSQADFERFMALVDSITAYFEILEEKDHSNNA